LGVGGRLLLAQLTDACGRGHRTGSDGSPAGRRTLRHTFYRRDFLALHLDASALHARRRSIDNHGRQLPRTCLRDHL
jgi:hypothetical protein